MKRSGRRSSVRLEMADVGETNAAKVVMCALPFSLCESVAISHEGARRAGALAFSQGVVPKAADFRDALIEAET